MAVSDANFQRNKTGFIPGSELQKNRLSSLQSQRPHAVPCSDTKAEGKIVKQNIFVQEDCANFLDMIIRKSSQVLRVRYPGPESQ